MSEDYRPPAVFGWLLRLAALIVPPGPRAVWRERREASLDSLWILAERGEFPGCDSDFLAGWFRDALANAFTTRCGRFDWRRSVRGPAFLMTACAAMLFLMASCTHGFAVTRWLLAGLAGPTSTSMQNRLVANIVPIVFAIAVSIMASMGRVSLGGYSWRYYCFLVLKTLAMASIVSLLWIEGGAALRGGIANQTVRVLVGGLFLATAFIAAFGCTVLWSLADQQRRCPVCLRRLVMPVRIGSWASVFEPVTTEWICEAGHGSLAVREVEAGAPDRWTEMAGAP